MKKKLTAAILFLLLTCIVFGQQQNEGDEFIPLIPMVGGELFGVDRAHSYLGFSIGFLGLNDVRGYFNRYDMAILYNENDMSKLSLTLVINAGSIDTRMRMRDDDLRGERFFAVDSFPNIMFQSNRVEKSADGYVVHGNLTMRGITKPISIAVRQTVRRQKDSGWQNVRIGFEGSVSLNRKDYGVNGGQFWGEKALSDTVEIEFNILGNRYNMEKINFARRNKPTVGDTLWQTALAKDGEAAFKLLLELRENQSDTYSYAPKDMMVIGKRLINRGQIDAGLKFFELALEIDPEYVDNHLALGEAYALKNNREKSRRHYQKALDLKPGEPLAIEMLRHLED